jgi:coiled-coil domain-containing protein 22
LDENYQIRKKTVALIQDAPNNINKLKEDIDNFDNKMKNLENQWVSVKEPLEQEKESIKNELNEKKNEMQIKLNGINSLKEQLNALNVELKSKDNEIKSLTRDYEALPTNKDTNGRQFYTKRILEIVSNIDRQKCEIEKILIETKTIQKEINQLSGKLERIFTSTDELVFKDAKKDESFKRAYKLFININEQYELLMKSIEETSVFVREIRDLEDQVDQENQTNVNESMQRLHKDYKQIKEENEQLTKALKQK